MPRSSSPLMFTDCVALRVSSSGVSWRTSTVSSTPPMAIGMFTSTFNPACTVTGVRRNRAKPLNSATIV